MKQNNILSLDDFSYSQAHETHFEAFKDKFYNKMKSDSWAKFKFIEQDPEKNSIWKV